VPAEAFSSGPESSAWSEDPAQLKPLGDAMLASGYNQFVLHSWAHQPFAENVKPGMTFGWWGLHFGPNQTWFEPGKAWIRYLSRAQAVLQHGAPVSDYCTYGATAARGDVISESALLQRVEVRDGSLVLPQGKRYAFLVLPDRDFMLPAVARRLKQLVSAGAVIVGPRPVRSPSMAGFPESDREVEAIGRELWGAIDGRIIFTHGYGKGLVKWGKSADEVLAELKIEPDLVFTPAAPDDIQYTHRVEGQDEIYFIANLRDKPARFSASFRTTGKAPEIWRPEDGTRAAAGIWSRHAGRTSVELALDGVESVFVIFRRRAQSADPITAARTTADPIYVVSGDADGRLHLRGAPGVYRLTRASGKEQTIHLPATPRALPLNGPWKVSFPAGWGASRNLTLDHLISWPQSADHGIKYFSGTARYSADIDVPAEMFRPDLSIVLDLGKVKNLAEIVINGRDVGVLWHAPFARDVTRAIQPGINHLEINITNLWPNRLIGDEQEPDDCTWGKAFDDPTTPPGMVGKPLAEFPSWFLAKTPRPSPGRFTFTTWNYFTKDSPLLESGLLGPVVLRPIADVVIAAKVN
jgi:hypothetical protein